MKNQKIIDFIRKTFENTGKQTAVIALSGGIDSAVSLALTVKAIGPNHVHAYYLPTKSSNPKNLTDISILTSNFQLPTSHFHLIPIGSIIQKYWRIIKRHSTPTPNNHIRLANLAARIRMMTIFDQAKKLDALVVGTENYSEHLLGYFTRFGDEASDLEPIRHLYKTEVIELAKALEIPQSIIDKPPSADLWSGQTDAQELGFTYQEADPILKLIDQGQTPTGELAEKILAQVNCTAFKHQVPYSVKI